MNSDLAEVLAELEDKYPDLDLACVLAHPSVGVELEDIADTLISAGCDASTVNRLLLDD